MPEVWRGDDHPHSEAGRECGEPVLGLFELSALSRDCECGWVRGIGGARVLCRPYRADRWVGRFSLGVAQGFAALPFQGEDRDCDLSLGLVRRGELEAALTLRAEAWDRAGRIDCGARIARRGGACGKPALEAAQITGWHKLSPDAGRRKCLGRSKPGCALAGPYITV